jgi:hypothetical protein
MYIYIYIEHMFKYTYTSTYNIFMYIHIWVCVCVCLGRHHRRRSRWRRNLLILCFNFILFINTIGDPNIRYFNFLFHLFINTIGKASVGGAAIGGSGPLRVGACGGGATARRGRGPALHSSIGAESRVIGAASRVPSPEAGLHAAMSYICMCVRVCVL